MKAAGAIATVALFSAAACGSSSNPRADATALSDECAAAVRVRPPDYASKDFFGLLTLGLLAINYPLPASFEDLMSRSDRVIVGRLKAVEEGNTYGGPRCSRTAHHTSNLIFQVERELRADGRTGVAVEWLHTRVVLTEDLVAKKPDSRMLAFLEDVRKYPPIPGADGGTPGPEKDLYYFRTPQGLIVEGPGGQLSIPLDPETDRRLDVAGLSLDSLIQRLSN